jgi:hypothetical protein
MTVDWNVGTAGRILEEHLGGLSANELIGNANDTSSPTGFPTPNNFTGIVDRRQIANGVTKTLYINFQAAPTDSGYTVQVHFAPIDCRISASK